ncbi:flagellar hook-length control protein FliK [Paracidovorax anthurii]|uniref:Flagellar hook-length control protein FliK n=1 Tax=Paracidovorax anthurii TaxID=78229 RepID=A0A328YVI5_9BURK|nr:flagellar hook-length control protein FliK [Paracidovorax anthurii]RAR76845.1 flagellar hook-length control protein FliK [Paracidovorax anthurii]
MTLAAPISLATAPATADAAPGRPLPGIDWAAPAALFPQGAGDAAQPLLFDPQWLDAALPPGLAEPALPADGPAAPAAGTDEAATPADASGSPTAPGAPVPADGTALLQALAPVLNVVLAQWQSTQPSQMPGGTAAQAPETASALLRAPAPAAPLAALWTQPAALAAAPGIGDKPSTPGGVDGLSSPPQAAPSPEAAAPDTAQHADADARTSPAAMALRAATAWVEDGAAPSSMAATARGHAAEGTSATGGSTHAGAAEPGAARHALVQALGERIKVQWGHGSERAVIRLDPPMMGSLEIVIRHEGGALQIQMTASHDGVARQLAQLSDTLRQDLVQRQFGDVSVQVSTSAGRDGTGRQRSGDGAAPDEDTPGQALAEAGTPDAPVRFTLA